MSDNKYAWGGEEENIDNTTPDQKDNVNQEEAFVQKETEEINIDEVLTAPKEAINRQAEIIKEIEEQEDKLESADVTIEHLTGLLNHIENNHYLVSQETRATALELAPELRLESAGSYTSVPSAIESERTVEAIADTIVDKSGDALSEAVKEGLEAIRKISELEGDFQAIIAANDDIIGEIYGKSFEKERAQTNVYERAMDVVHAIQHYYQEANRDIFGAARDPELVAHLNNRIETFKGFATSDHSPLRKLAKLMAQKLPGNQVIAEKLVKAEQEVAHAFHAFIDYSTTRGSTAYSLITGKVTHLPTRFNESLDRVGEALTNASNFLAEYEVHDDYEMMANFELNRLNKTIVDYRDSQDFGLDHSSPYTVTSEIPVRCLQTFQEYFMERTERKEGTHSIDEDIISKALGMNITALDERLVNALVHLNRNLSSVVVYTDFYEHVLLKAVRQNWETGRHKDHPAARRLYNRILMVATMTVRIMTRSIAGDFALVKALMNYRDMCNGATFAILHCMYIPCSKLAEDFEDEEFERIYEAILALEKACKDATSIIYGK